MNHHSYYYTGKMPVTGVYRCYKCGKIDSRGHWNWENQTDTCPETLLINCTGNELLPKHPLLHKGLNL